MRQVSIRLPEEMLAEMNEQIDGDVRHENRSQFVRAAVRRMLSREYEQSG